jgi:hypothetical protein
VFAVDKNGVLKKTPDGEYLILRNDSARLFATMAAAITRYFHDRARAELIIAGIMPATGILGFVLTVIEEGGQLRNIQAPITAVEYELADVANIRTRIRAGYAR